MFCHRHRGRPSDRPMDRPAELRTETDKLEALSSKPSDFWRTNTNKNHSISLTSSSSLKKRKHYYEITTTNRISALTMTASWSPGLFARNWQPPTLWTTRPSEHFSVTHHHPSWQTLPGAKAVNVPTGQLDCQADYRANQSSVFPR